MRSICGSAKRVLEISLLTHMRFTRKLRDSLFEMLHNISNGLLNVPRLTGFVSLSALRRFTKSVYRRRMLMFPPYDPQYPS